MAEVLLILTGILVGIGISSLAHRNYFIGNLRIDNSDPIDGPYMFLELEKDVGSISNKKHVLLRVERENFIPHE